MKIKVSEATNPQLNYLVAKAQGFDVWHSALLNGRVMHGFWVSGYYPGDLNSWVPLSKIAASTDWPQGGPILEREKISPYYMPGEVGGAWRAEKLGRYMQAGPTPLIAAMRCFVCSKLGDTVEVPEELCK